MGIVRQSEIMQAEIEEFRRTLLSHAGTKRRKEDGRRAVAGGGDDDVFGSKVVCVTAGASFLGFAIVKRLLIGGYSVRVQATSEEEKEKVREAGLWREMGRVSVVMADISDVQSLSAAFDGCSAVFHTASFVDPAGVSGYSKYMADVEVKTTEKVMEACGRTSSVRHCVLTSSLLACVWRDTSQANLSPVVNHGSWSDELVVEEKKLWCALGKLRAEKAAWRIAAERAFKLVTICPGLIIGPNYSLRNPTATIAYLKGIREMYADGLLATVDVNRLAEAHVRVFEAMNKAAFGRYICFDRVITEDEEAEKLTEEVGIPATGIPVGNSSFRFMLSNSKLSGLMSRAGRCSDQF